MTEPSTPEEVVAAVLDDLLATTDDIDTQVYADNVITILRATGFMPLAEGDSH